MPVDRSISADPALRWLFIAGSRLVGDRFPKQETPKAATV
jgi:hypothetical protein